MIGFFKNKDKAKMEIEFYKYEGTGNDFVMIDNRSDFFPRNDIKLVAFLCNRKFGIGADGLILLENDESADFKMVYFNSDGSESSMCGNGGRCIVAFAKKMKLIETNASFMAIDGLHQATISDDNSVSLQMKNVDEIQISENYSFTNTGSPHHVEMVADLENLDVKNEGFKIRNSILYKKNGCNINFVEQIAGDEFSIRTYERGVEAETLSCGTGATAVAIVMNAIGKTNHNKIKINVEGGNLEVSFEKENQIYKNIFLNGVAKFVFYGLITV